MMIATLSGALVGGGLALVARSIKGQRTSLLTQITAVQTARPRQIMGTLTWRERLDRWLLGQVGTRPIFARAIGADLRQDLAILNLDMTPYLVRKVALAAVALIISPVVFSALAMAAGLPLIGGLWLALSVTALVFFLPDSDIRRRARTRRNDVVSSLSSYLDLVALRAASGSGASEALRDASSVGNGYGWSRIRSALQGARLAGRPPAAGLGDLGQDLGISDLVELANQLALVDETGAQTEATLRAKAEALRVRQRTLLEGDAKARSSTMFLGQVLLALGYLVFLGYPAVIRIMTL